MAQSITVSVEAPIENQIMSIDYDGTEVYAKYVKILIYLTKIVNYLPFPVL